MGFPAYAAGVHKLTHLSLLLATEDHLLLNELSHGSPCIPLTDRDPILSSGVASIMLPKGLDRTSHLGYVTNVCKPNAQIPYFL